jgi:hypothetical protein
MAAASPRLTPRALLETWATEKDRILFASFNLGGVTGSTYCSVNSVSDSALRLSWENFGTYRGELIFPFSEVAFDDVASTGITSGKTQLNPNETCLRLTRGADESCILVTIRSLETEYPRLS